jgi:hypothetical protein
MQAVEQDYWEQIGDHLFRVYEPDVFFMRLRGDIGALDVIQMLTECDRIAADRPPLFWVNDAAELGDIPVEARTIASKAHTDASVAAYIIFGAKFNQRLAATLLVKSAAFFRRPGGDVPVVFLDTEADARAWIAAHRREHRPRRELLPIAV